MVQRLDLISLTAPEDEQHTEAATDVPMQMSLVSISSLAAKVSFRGDLAARLSTMLWGVFISEVGQNIKGQLVGVALSFLRKFGILSGASGVLGALSSEVASAALDDRFAVQRAQQKQVSAARAVRALYCILHNDTDLWVAVPQDPPHKCRLTVALLRRSRTVAPQDIEHTD
ncbi:hypothetical protein WJX82_009937 [Trebouxia sp. C0006]